MTKSAARKSLRLAYKAYGVMLEAWKVATPQNADGIMLQGFHTSANGLRNTIFQLCKIVPNGTILHRCFTCQREWHIGRCSPPTQTLPEILAESLEQPRMNRCMERGDFDE